MRAIIIATGYSENMNLVSDHYPLGLIPFIDRPFLQHIVEAITKVGIKNIDFILHHLPEKVEEFLGEGERWGSKFIYHLAANGEEPYKNLKSIDISEDKVLLAHEFYRPVFSIDINTFEAKPFFSDEKWLGWGIFSREEVSAFAEMKTFENISNHLLKNTEKKYISNYISIDSYENTLNSMNKVLNKEFTDILLKGKEIEPGVWLSRNVILPSNVEIKAPIYINENCKVGNQARLLGNVVLGEGCIVSEKTSLENTIVFPKSYIGEALELNTSIVDKNRLINVQIGAEIEVADDFILGSITDNTINKFIVNLVSRLSGCVLFVLTLPLLLISFVFVIFNKSTLEQVIKLPAKKDPGLWKTFSMKTYNSVVLSPWKHFFLIFVPGLWQIVKGNVRFVGVPPRTKNQIEQLPKDWQALYLNSKIGLVTEQYAMKLPSDEDNMYAAEAFYSVSCSFRHDLKLMIKYFLRVLVNR